MYTWKIIMHLFGKTLEFYVKANTYNEAYVNAGIMHPEGRVRSVKQVQQNDKPDNSQSKL